MGNIPREFFSDPKSPQCKAERTAENVGIGIGIIVALTLIFAPIFFFADAASRSSVERFKAEQANADSAKAEGGATMTELDKAQAQKAKP